MKKLALLVGLLLLSCQTSEPVSQTLPPATEGGIPAATVPLNGLTQPTVLSISTPEKLESADARISSNGKDDAVALKVIIKRPTGFRTQAFDLSRIKFLKAQVRSLDITNPLYNKEGFVTANAPQKSLRVEGVPKGHNRIVKVQAYDGTAGNEALMNGLVPGLTLINTK